MFTAKVLHCKYKRLEVSRVPAVVWEGGQDG